MYDGFHLLDFKGSSDPSRFIFETNVGKSRTRHRTTLNLNEIIFNRFGVDLEIQFQSRCMSDPTISDIDFTNKMAWVWTTLKISNQDLGWGRVRIDSYHNELSSTLAVCS